MILFKPADTSSKVILICQVKCDTSSKDISLFKPADTSSKDALNLSLLKDALFKPADMSSKDALFKPADTSSEDVR